MKLFAIFKVTTFLVFLLSTMFVPTCFSDEPSAKDDEPQILDLESLKAKPGMIEKMKKIFAESAEEKERKEKLSKIYLPGYEIEGQDEVLKKQFSRLIGNEKFDPFHPENGALGICTIMAHKVSPEIEHLIDEVVSNQKSDRRFFPEVVFTNYNIEKTKYYSVMAVCEDPGVLKSREQDSLTFKNTALVLETIQNNPNSCDVSSAKMMRKEIVSACVSDGMHKKEDELSKTCKEKLSGLWNATKRNFPEGDGFFTYDKDRSISQAEESLAHEMYEQMRGNCAKKVLACTSACKVKGSCPIQNPENLWTILTGLEYMNKYLNLKSLRTDEDIKMAYKHYKAITKNYARDYEGNIHVPDKTFKEKSEKDLDYRAYVNSFRNDMISTAFMYENRDASNTALPGLGGASVENFMADDLLRIADELHDQRLKGADKIKSAKPEFQVDIAISEFAVLQEYLNRKERSSKEFPAFSIIRPLSGKNPGKDVIDPAYVQKVLGSFDIDMLTNFLDKTNRRHNPGLRSPVFLEAISKRVKELLNDSTIKIDSERLKKLLFAYGASAGDFSLPFSAIGLDSRKLFNRNGKDRRLDSRNKFVQAIGEEKFKDLLTFLDEAKENEQKNIAVWQIQARAEKALNAQWNAHGGKYASVVGFLIAQGQRATGYDKKAPSELELEVGLVHTGMIATEWATIMFAKKFLAPAGRLDIAVDATMGVTAAGMEAYYGKKYAALEKEYDRRKMLKPGNSNNSYADEYYASSTLSPDNKMDAYVNEDEADFNGFALWFAGRALATKVKYGSAAHGAAHHGVGGGGLIYESEWGRRFMSMFSKREAAVLEKAAVVVNAAAPFVPAP